MTPITPEPPEAIRNRAVPLAAILLLLAPLAPHAYAQSPAAKLADLSSANEQPPSYKTFYLTNLIRPHDADDIQTDLRNMLPAAKLYYVPAQSALSIRGSAEDIALAQKILADLDHPRKAYRLTYTITETGSGQPDSGQHVTLIVTSGGTTDFKQGSKVPIVIGVDTQGQQPPRSDVQYMDIGLEIEATLNGYDGVHLRSKIAQSSVADEKSGVGTARPQSSARPHSTAPPPSCPASRSSSAPSTSPAPTATSKSKSSQKPFRKHLPAKHNGATHISLVRCGVAPIRSDLAIVRPHDGLHCPNRSQPEVSKARKSIRSSKCAATRYVTVRPSCSSLWRAPSRLAGQRYIPQ